MGRGSGGRSAGAEGAGVVAHGEQEDAQDMHVFSLGGESGGLETRESTKGNIYTK